MLDTNIVSELRKARAGKADANVAAWARGVSSRALFLSAIVVLELEVGVLLAQRRDPAQGALLSDWLQDQVLPAFEDRILAVDAVVARRAAALQVPDPKPFRDALIAATAFVHGLTVVTRNVADFHGAGVQILNPWNARAL